MRRVMFACLGVFLIFLSATAQAGDRHTLGFGRLFTNDYIVDGQDRWRTGSYAISMVTGFAWDGELPRTVGEIIEYRFRSEIIAPSNLIRAAPGDRRYVGALSFGAHTHFQKKGLEISLGGDLVVTGEQTGMGWWQSQFHMLVGEKRPGVLGNQIPNGFHPTATLEIGRTLDTGPGVTLRPFVEMQAGAETLLRAGGDVMFGTAAAHDLFLRDVTTGQRYRATRTDATGLSLVLGGDVAYVADSIYLPSSDGYRLTDARVRARAGLHWQGQNSALFYGVTWLGREFSAQPEGQLVGSLRLNIRF